LLGHAEHVHLGLSLHGLLEVKLVVLSHLRLSKAGVHWLLARFSLPEVVIKLLLHWLLEVEVFGLSRLFLPSHYRGFDLLTKHFRCLLLHRRLCNHWLHNLRLLNCCWHRKHIVRGFWLLLNWGRHCKHIVRGCWLLLNRGRHRKHIVRGCWLLLHGSCHRNRLLNRCRLLLCGRLLLYEIIAQRIIIIVGLLSLLGSDCNLLVCKCKQVRELLDFALLFLAWALLREGVHLRETRHLRLHRSVEWLLRGSLLRSAVLNTERIHRHKSIHRIGGWLSLSLWLERGLESIRLRHLWLHLRLAHLRHAHLRLAHLWHAHLRLAHLRLAHLRLTHLRLTHLVGLISHIASHRIWCICIRPRVIWLLVLHRHTCHDFVQLVDWII